MLKAKADPLPAYVLGLPEYPGDEQATEPERWIRRNITHPDRARHWHYPWEPRDQYIRMFGFAIITDSALRWLMKHPALTPDPAFVGVGSGSGYLEHEIRKRGAGATATDPAPWHETHGRPSPHPVTMTDHRGATEMIKNTPNGVMILSWPEMNGMWTQQAVIENPSDTLVFIGEGHSESPGCTGSAAMLRALDDLYILADSTPVPNFVGISDDLRIYLRKAPLA